MNINTGQILSDNLSFGNGGVTEFAIGDSLVYILGNFTDINGVGKGRSAAIKKSDRTLTPFDIKANNSIETVFLKDSLLFLGGNFTFVGGQFRNRIACININSGKANSWDPNSNAQVRSIVVNDTSIFVSGYFSILSGQNRSRLAEYDLRTLALTPWNPGLGGTPFDLKIVGNDLFVAGSFSSIGGTTVNNFAKIDINSKVISSYQPKVGQLWSVAQSGDHIYFGGAFVGIDADLTKRNMVAYSISGDSLINMGFNPSSAVHDIVAENNTLYIGGNFTSILNQNRSRFCAYDLTGDSLLPVNLNFSGSVDHIELSSNAIFLAGRFTQVNNITKTRVCKIDKSTGALNSWTASVNSTINDLQLNGSKLYIVGSFNNVNGTSRNRIAALSPTTGALDSWYPSGGANSTVNALLIRGDTVYVGGFFSQAGGVSSRYVARINRNNASTMYPFPGLFERPLRSFESRGASILIGGYFQYVQSDVPYLISVHKNTGELTSWRPNPNEAVEALAIQGNTLYAGGRFTSIMSTTRNKLAGINLNSNTLTSLSFTVGTASDRIQYLFSSGDTLFMSGTFATINSSTRLRLAAVKTSNNSLLPFAPNANGSVYDIAIEGDSVFIAGDYSYIGGAPRENLSKVSRATGLAGSFNPPYSTGQIYSATVVDTSLYVAGSHTFSTGINHRYFFAYNSNTKQVIQTNFNLNNVVYALETSGNRLFIGGSFSSILGTNRPRFAVLKKSDLTLDTLSPAFNSTVFDIFINDTTLFVGGSFSTYNSAACPRLIEIRLSNGTRTSFDPNLNSGYIESIDVSQNKVLAGGFGLNASGFSSGVRLIDRATDSVLTWNTGISSQVYGVLLKGDTALVGGGFTTRFPTSRRNLAAIVDSTNEILPWNPQVNSIVYTLELHDTSLYVGGAFSSVGPSLNITRQNIARVGSQSGIWHSWTTNTNSAVREIKANDSAVYVGGQFTSIGGVTRNRIAKVSHGGTVNSWNPNANNTVYSIALEDTLMYVGGDFTSIGSTSRSRVAAIHTTSGMPTAWNISPNNSVKSIRTDQDRIYMGGNFNRIGNTWTGYMAVLNKSTNIVEQNNQAANSLLNSIALYGGNVALGGRLSYSGGIQTRNVAIYNIDTKSGLTWSPNPSAEVYRVEAFGKDLYIGGTFTSIENENRRYLVKYTAPCLNSSSTTTISACGSYTWNANNNTYSNGGTYYQVLTNADGCDSILTLNLTIQQGNQTNAFQTACDSYTWSNTGLTYDSTGVYYDSLTNVNGCDSVIILNLTIKNSTSRNDTVQSCESYTWRGQTYTSSGTYRDTLTNSQNCDSLLTLYLTINYNDSSSMSATACDSYTWSVNSMTYTSSGTYKDTLQTVNNCDSVVTLNLTINYSDSSSMSVTACDSYRWSVNSMTYTSSGTYKDTLRTANNCDSVVTLNLTINYSDSSSMSATACDSYTWSVNSMTYSTSGIYRDTLQTANNCDSVVTLNLTINYSDSSSMSATACDSYTWSVNSMTYTTSGTYKDTLQTANNCDSVVTLNLTINYRDSSSMSVTACDSYTWSVNSMTYTSSGTYKDTLRTANNCDSVVTLNLTINYSDSSSMSATACDSYTWSVNSMTYSTSGIYRDTLQTANNCDSVVTLNLTINYSDSSSMSATACDSYTWSVNSMTYTTSGTYKDTLQMANNCDSVVTLNLTINYRDSSSMSVTACDSYTWSVNSMTYTSSGIYRDTLQTANNCDSVVTLNLTINYSSSSNMSATACDSYTWSVNSMTYTASGTYRDTLQTVNNCDSVVALNLTINNSTASSMSATACDSYTWTVNSMTYTTSGTYVDTLQTVNNCDSVVTLNLTINYSDTSSMSATACDSYTWSVNSMTYTSSGTYRDTLQTVNNCDSVVTLNLTINYSDTSSMSATSCDSYTWSVNSMTYTASGTYRDTLQTINNCDSVVTLNLTINYKDSSSMADTACDMYTWSVNSMTYAISGTYMDTLQTIHGCDSVVTLTLRSITKILLAWRIQLATCIRGV